MDSISILDEECNKTVVFIIETKLVNTFYMNTIEQYLKSGSSNNVPRGALQILDIVLKNRLNSLRYVVCNVRLWRGEGTKVIKVEIF